MSGYPRIREEIDALTTDAVALGIGAAFGVVSYLHERGLVDALYTADPEARRNVLGLITQEILNGGDRELLAHSIAVMLEARRA